MTDQSPDDRREAAAQMGRARTPKKAEAARENGKLGGRPPGSGRPFSDETKAKMREAQRLRREREQAVKDGNTG